MPKVSVLMPIWNTREDHLREAMESILNQTFTDFEILILNDSPDNTKLDEIVASYNDPRIHYARNEKNMGITPSRNKLLQMARGEYIAICDHDDICLPERLEKQVRHLDEHPETGVVGSWAEVFPATRIISFPTEDYAIKKAMTHECVMIHPAAMLRKSVLEQNRICYEEVFSPAEDYCLWLRLMEFTQFHNIPEILFKYRLHETNTSKQQSTKMGNAHQRLVQYAHTKYQELHQAYLSECIHTRTIRFFNLFPIISITSIGMKCNVKFLGIPILTIKSKITPPY